MAIFDEFIVVDEKVMSEFSIGIYSFRDVTQFAALQFMINVKHFGIIELKITDIGHASNPSNSEPLAQIIHWKWDQNETQILKKGSEVNFNIHIHNVSPSFVIRILKKREKKLSPFPAPSSSSPDDDLTVKIGDKQVAVSAHWLMSVSPVISRMLSVEMKEKQQGMITLDELGVDMDQFKQFLEAITHLNGPFMPNPTNVLMLLKLADYFQVTALKSRCELHLINCVEIPLIDRFLLIERFGLDNFKANHQQVFPVISKEFLGVLLVRLSEQ